ncbi:MAG: serine/threonine protein kinase [Thermomicrobiales bacterium]|nr:serine/threonine protein kinase [Thermomicrobiales bacterium]
MNESTPWIAGTLGERYDLEQLIGEGAFARTYRARDTRLGRVVAVKLLRSHYAADPSFLERFQREAWSAARVDHPNVVHVYDYGEHDGVYYLVLQYVPGRDLKRMIEERAPLSPADAIRIGREILSGLAAIHAAGIIHRDIKPQNVLIGRDGVPRVTDFGIAFEPSQSRLTSLTNHGETLGTPAYMAPEQARGEPVSEATDLYAVGVVLFEMLTGRLPFRGENALAMMVAHVEQPPEPPSAYRAGVPTELDAVVLRALAKDPSRRFASAGEMERALSDALSHAHNGAPPTELAAPAAPTRVRATAPAAATATVPLPTRTFPVPPAPGFEPPAARGRRRGGGWIAPVLIAIVAFAALIVALVKANGGDYDGNGNGAGVQPTRTATKQAGLVFITETPEEEPTRRVIDRGDDPTTTNEPEPTDEPEPEPTEEPDGVPTIAPSNGGIVTPEPTETPEDVDSEPVSLEFVAEDWQGGLVRSDSGFLGRPWSAVYGANSGYGEATLSFTLDAAPAGEAELTITGVDDEAGGDSPISISVDGVEVFAGPSPFANWDGDDDSNAPWTTLSLTLPAGLLQEGENRITVANLDPSSTIDSPPYVLLSDAALTAE